MNSQTSAPLAIKGRTQSQIDLDRVYRKVTRRVVTLLVIVYFIGYLDRVALSFAGPTGMSKDLQLTGTLFGFAAGIFFIGYILFAVPSNVVLNKVGARRWLSVLMVIWGAIQVATAFVPNATWLIIARFALGAAEAGFAPGAMFYLTLWYSNQYRGRAVTKLLLAATVAVILGGPISAALISLGSHAFFGTFEPWRFLIVVTGIPAVLLGFVCWFMLTDRPAEAKWLSPSERNMLEAAVASDSAHIDKSTVSVRHTLANPLVWIMALALFLLLYGSYAITFFLPSMIAGFQSKFGTTLNIWQSSILIAIPFTLAAIATLYLGKRVDRKGHAGAHIAWTMVVGIAGAALASIASTPFLMLVALSLLTIGVCASTPLLYVIISKISTGVGTATALAFAGSVGALGGLVGPYLTGWLQDSTDSDSAGIIAIGVFLAFAGFLAVLGDRTATRQSVAASAVTSSEGRRREMASA